MMDSNIKEDIDDVILWPDGYWCFRFELEEHPHRSDDYKVYFKNNPNHEPKYKKYVEFL